jgi:hypothetical protein
MPVVQARHKGTCHAATQSSGMAYKRRVFTTAELQSKPLRPQNVLAIGTGQRVQSVSGWECLSCSGRHAISSLC